ncbi:MAG: PLP-dependent transferase [Burkholderiales bacterium]|nr:PLP-dependent transferase [Burkholderiales bacterium]
MYTKISAKDKEVCLIDKDYPNQAVNTPIYQNSIFHFNTVDDYLLYKNREIKAFCYTRGNNPTTEVLEDKLAKLDGGESCRVFSSGMGAITATLFALLTSGDHVLVINDIYGPTREYLSVLSKFGIGFDVISATDTKNLEFFIKENTRVIYTESPGTMTFDVVDLRLIASIAKTRGVYTVIDNTCMTPLLQKPLLLGFDIAVYSLSKYTGGHSDVLAGAVVGSREILAKIDKEGYKLGGSVISPNDAFLLLRGLRTLPSRLETLTLITSEVVTYLQKNEKVKNILHPLAYNDTDLELYQAQTTGITSLLSLQLVTTDTKKIKMFIDSLKTFSIAVSWGGYENLVMVQDVLEFTKAHSDKIIIRLALGLFDASTIIADLEQAFNQIEGK